MFSSGGGNPVMRLKGKRAFLLAASCANASQDTCREAADAGLVLPEGGALTVALAPSSMPLLPALHAASWKNSHALEWFTPRPWTLRHSLQRGALMRPWSSEKKHWLLTCTR